MRTVKVLGRSIPLGVILASVAIMAVGAWAIAHYFMANHATGQAGAAPPPINLTVSDPRCSLGGTGTITTCARFGTQGGVDLAVNGISNNEAGGNTTLVEVDFTVTNNSAQSVAYTVNWTPVPGMLITNTPTVWTPGQTFSTNLYISFPDIQPGQFVDSGPLILDFAPAP